MAVGWTLVSPGKHADSLLAPAISMAEDTQLVAVCSRDQARADAFADKHGAHAAYTSLEDLVADARVDAVLIASPNFLDAPYTTIAARAGNMCWSKSPWPCMWKKQSRWSTRVGRMA
jgi:predicted dehydrogenase